MNDGSRRIGAMFERLSGQERAGLGVFLMGGDPTYEASFEIMRGLPGAGVDFIELGVAFTDPMADGPSIQAAGRRALAAGATLEKTLAMVEKFRAEDAATPVILMGYYNPIYAFPADEFLTRAKAAGVDGLIVVDLPPEEDAELCLPARQAGLDFVRLASPTTNDQRLPKVLQNTSGFVYYISVAGVTGGKTGDNAVIERDVGRIRAASGLPVAVGFGVKTPDMAADVARRADAVIVGSALVDKIAGVAAQAGADQAKGVNDVLSFARDLGTAVKTARSRNATAG